MQRILVAVVDGELAGFKIPKQHHGSMGDEGKMWVLLGLNFALFVVTPSMFSYYPCSDADGEPAEVESPLQYCPHTVFLEVMLVGIVAEP